ncbi:MAG: CusA/CzcA family heavy metal efflux RND transporter [Bacteroidia bacterium]
MLNSIIRFSVKNKLVIGLMTVALMLTGIYQIQHLPIDAVPDITDNQVQVITVSPALGAPDVERLITYPIEQINSNIPGIKEIRSFSRFGLSLVTIVFTDETDVYWARQQVTERLQQVRSQIPEGLGTPELAPVTTGLGEIYQYVLRPAEGYGEKYGAQELRTIQDWIVRRQLLGVKGIADISSFGGKLKQYEIAVDSRKLQSYGLSISDIFTALSENNANTGGAYIEKGPMVLFIRSEGLVNNLHDIEQIAVRQLPSGIPVMMKDVAEIRFGYANRYGAMIYNDQGEVAGGVVMMLKGANSSEVILHVKERIEQIRKTLPQGVILEPFLDRTKMVNNAIGTVEKNLLEGSLIVVFILVLFLGHLRAGLIVASVIPLSMLFAVILMNIFGVSGNLMSLGALDFGLIVDGAVIIVEAVMHRLMHNRKLGEGRVLVQEEMDHEVQSSASRMMNSAVFGQIIILIVYLPIFMLEGIEGKMFKPMAQTVAFALLGAFILSLTYIPMMSSLFLSKKISHKKTISDKMMEGIEATFSKTLDFFIRKPVWVLAGTVIAFFLSIVLLINMGGEFIPKLEEGDLAVDTRVMTGSNLQTTIQATTQAAKLLREKFPEVQKVVTKIGSGEIPTDPMPIEASDMMVILKDKSEWTSAKSFDELTEKMSHELQQIPGITAGFQYPVQMRFNELMTGARQDVVCKIFGEDLDTLTHYAEKLGAVVQKVEGARDLYVESMTGMPQIVIRYNRQALAQYGVPVDEVNKVVNTAFAGQASGLVFEGERRFDLVVRLAGELRKDPDDVRNLLITTPTGLQIPLYQIAEIEVKDGPNQIQREDAKRRIIVGFNVRGKDIQSVVKELEGMVQQQIKLPAGYYVTYGGAFENLVEAKKRLGIAVPIALALIFLMLYFAFGSFGQGLLIFTAIPLSAIGGIIALSMRGLPFSISAGIGFIALFGVAVLNGIVLLTEFNRIRKDGELDPVQIVKRGTQTRLRPVLMTAAVASLGFLPMALSTGAGAEVQKPLATVVIGGLVSATFLTLVLIPVLYINRQRWITRNISPKAMLLMILMGAVGTLQAQTRIPVETAIDSAMHHPSYLARRFETEKRKAMRQSAWDPGPLSVTGEFGQVNSNANDQKLVISQDFSLPLVYIRKSQAGRAETSSARYQQDQAALELRREILILYTSMATSEAKLQLLASADSLFHVFVTKSEQQLQAGLLNTTEQAYAGLAGAGWANSRREEEGRYRQLAEQFRKLTGFGEDALPLTEGFDPVKAYGMPDTTANVLQHPAMKAANESITATHARLRYEQSQNWPGFNIGYFRQTIKGWQSDGNGETYYGGQDYFTGVMAGVKIPLYRNLQHGTVKAARMDEAIARETARETAIQLELMLTEAKTRMQTNSGLLQWYQQKGLRYAETISTDAAKRLRNGDIDYLQWTLLMAKSIETQQQYLETLRAYREAYILYQSLTGKL